MTGADIIAEVKRILPEDTEEDVLLSRIDELSQIIERELVETHEGASPSFPRGGEAAKYAYIYYLLMKNDGDLCDTEGYLAHAAMFRDAYGDFADLYNRTHLPKTEEVRL